MLDDFAIFILTHGRADNVLTYRTLQRAGYTGRVYFVIDNEDKQAAQYYENFGDKVIMFDKAAIAEVTDYGDNFDGRGIVVFARNAVFDIAEGLGIEYFLVLDDDYTGFCYTFNERYEYINNMRANIYSFDAFIVYALDYFKSINALTVAFAQSGDKIGGMNSDFFGKVRTKRKAMNSFICSTKRRFDFVGRVNEDVNTYVRQGNNGRLFLTANNAFVYQITTQKNQGGLTDTYLEQGTYVKSFYTVMYQPSSVKVSLMGENHKRLHHRIDWETTVPCIISEDLRKASRTKAQSLVSDNSHP